MTVPRYVALLRGVNVGGKNVLPMKDLAALCVAEGCSDVRTFIQSGNVVFSADPTAAESLPARLADAIERGFGFRSPVVLRTAEDLAAVPANNPFPDTDHVHVVFLADRPDPAAVSALDPDRSPGDQFAVVGRDVYAWLPNGVGRSKLTNTWLDKQLSTVSTIRNWRTVLSLIDLAR